jgi:hypothetical protein
MTLLHALALIFDTRIANWASAVVIHFIGHCDYSLISRLNFQTKSITQKIEKIRRLANKVAIVFQQKITDAKG